VDSLISFLGRLKYVHGLTFFAASRVDLSRNIGSTVESQSVSRSSASVTGA